MGMDFKEVYITLLKDLTGEQLKILDANCQADDYKARVIYIVKNWPKEKPAFLEERLEHVAVNNFQAFSLLIKNLSDKGLLLRNNLLTDMQLKDERYLISINRSDRKKVHIYCDKEVDKESLSKEIAEFDWKYKKMIHTHNKRP